MLIDRNAVTRFIPQRPPIVVVHGLLKHSDTSSVSVFHVENGHLFVRNGSLLPSGIMENIAQSAALRSGYVFLQSPVDDERPAAPPIGFIGALKNFVLAELPPVGSVLHTTLTVLHEVMGMQVIQAEVHEGAALMASCEMKIFLSNGP